MLNEKNKFKPSQKNDFPNPNKLLLGYHFLFTSLVSVILLVPIHHT